MNKTHITLIALGLAASSAQAATINLENSLWTATGPASVTTGNNTVASSPTGNSEFGYVTTSAGIYNVSPLVLKNEGRGTENHTNGAKIQSSVFSAQQNDSLRLYFNFVTTDGRGYDDYAWARLVNAGSQQTAAWLFTARATNSANGNVVPGNVLKRQVDNSLPDELDAVLNDGNTVGFNVAGTNWAPLGYSSGACWDSANTCGPTGWIKSDYVFTTSASYYLEFGVINWGDEAYDSGLAFDFNGLQAANMPQTAVPVPGAFGLMVLGVAVMSGRLARKRS